MPDFCYTDLTIHSSQEDLAKIQEYCLSNSKDNNGLPVKVFDFERILPHPKKICNVSFHSQMADELRYFCLKSGTPWPSKTEGSQFLRSKNLATSQGGREFTITDYETDFRFCFGDDAFQEGQRIYQNLQQFGVAGILDWRSKHWNTKWNACESTNGFRHLPDGDISISFATAWNPPTPIFEELSRKFPDALFEVFCKYEDMADDDFWTYQNGVMTKHTQQPSSFLPEKD